VRRNEAFHGLQADQDLQSYLHFRNVQTQAYKDQLDQPGAPFNPNFLESIIDDQPRGLWTIQGGKDHDDKIITIRSIMWPGFIFYHKAGTKKFGNLYIGDGLKNEELHFMI
jgi:radial spoke head protein 9